MGKIQLQPNTLSLFRRKALTLLQRSGTKLKNRQLLKLLAVHYGTKELPKAKIDQIHLFMGKMAEVSPKPRVKNVVYINSPAVETDFLRSYEWRRVRMEVLIRDGRKCACCGATPDTGAIMHVDHIKPRRTHPKLALDTSNLQVLCEECNHGKGNWNSTDWRQSS